MEHQAPHPPSNLRGVFPRCSDAEDTLFAQLLGANGGSQAGDERTGLAVAGALRRMRLYTREFGERGLILVEDREFARWAKMQGR